MGLETQTRNLVVCRRLLSVFGLNSVTGGMSSHSKDRALARFAGSLHDDATTTIMSEIQGLPFKNVRRASAARVDYLAIPCFSFKQSVAWDLLMVCRWRAATNLISLIPCALRLGISR